MSAAQFWLWHWASSTVSDNKLTKSLNFYLMRLANAKVNVRAKKKKKKKKKQPGICSNASSTEMLYLVSQQVTILSILWWWQPSHPQTSWTIHVCHHILWWSCGNCQKDRRSNQHGKEAFSKQHSAKGQNIYLALVTVKTNSKGMKLMTTVLTSDLTRVCFKTRKCKLFKHWKESGRLTTSRGFNTTRC